MQTLIYALAKGETERYTEALISSHCRTLQDVERVKAAASADGWHSFRVVGFVLEKPDFAKTINK